MQSWASVRRPTCRRPAVSAGDRSNRSRRLTDMAPSYYRGLLSAMPTISRSRFMSQLIKSAPSGSFSKLSTKTTRFTDRFDKLLLKRPEQMLRVEVKRHDGMRERLCQNSKFLAWIAEFSTLRLCYDRSGCIRREAHFHNSFKMAATYQSCIFGSQRQLSRL